MYLVFMSDHIFSSFKLGIALAITASNELKIEINNAAAKGKSILLYIYLCPKIVMFHCTNHHLFHVNLQQFFC